MSDSTIKEKNERELELLWRKKQKFDEKEQQQNELLRRIPDLKSKSEFIDVTVSHVVDVLHSDFIFTHTDAKIQSETDYRLTNLEEKVAWLSEGKIDQYSDVYLDDIKNEFSSLPFIQKIFVEKIPTGYDLVIIYNEEKSKNALSAITHSKINLKKKLTNIYLELTVLRSSDFNKKEWESRKLIFERN